MVVARIFRPAVKAALKQGWTLTQGRTAHPKLTSPDGYSTPVPSSSNDGSLLRGFEMRLRKHGVDL